MAPLLDDLNPSFTVAVAKNKFNDCDHATPDHPADSTLTADVAQVVPSVDDICIPEALTPDNAITVAPSVSAETQLALGVLRPVHVVPSGEVMTRLVVPAVASAINSDPTDDHMTKSQSLLDAAVRIVHSAPVEEVATRCDPVTSETATATNSERLGDHAMDL